MRFPGFNSYRGRYIFIAVMFSCLLLLFALFGYSQVENASRDGIERIRERSEATLMLSDVLAQLNRLEATIQRLVIAPSGKLEASIRRTRSMLAVSLEQLKDSRWRQRHPRGAELVAELLADSTKLADSTETLIDIRGQEERWFPATSVMRNELLPHARITLDLLKQIDQEAELELTGEPRFQVLQQTNRMRTAWLNMTSELRLLVANRFGVFSNNSQAAMKARLENIRLHASVVPDALEALRTMEKQDILGFTATNNLPLLVDNLSDWMSALGVLVQRLSRPDWRMDLIQVHTRIDPVMGRMRERLSALQLEMDQQSAQDITALTDASRLLSRTMLLIAGLVILLTILSYVFFSRLLLRPIADTTRALKEEALGRRDNVPPQTDLAETRDLIDAFHEMRRQVRSRETRLDHMAHHDGLTRLPNRTLFNDRLDHALRMAQRRDQRVALMFLDLDRFKQINDTLGHGVGDSLLIEVGKRLSHVVRQSDTVARLGGDEFAIVAEGLTSADEINLLAEKVLAVFYKPFNIDRHNLHVRTSIGIARCPDDYCEADDLTKAADTAMYEAKRRGRGNFQYYSAKMLQRAQQQMSLENALHQALEEQQFEVYYHPILHVSDNRLLAFESLLRWHHPEHGLVTAGVFLSALEESGLITPVSSWLVDQTIAMEASLADLDGGPWGISINMTSRLLKDRHFANSLCDHLADGHLSADRLVIEVNENAIDGDPTGSQMVLEELKKRGAKIAIDDFGTGRSSLEHLRRFPFDLVKIDREFIRDIEDDPNDRKLVQAIIQMSHALHMEVVAEGVETEPQLAFLREHHCDYYQGYLCCRPIPSAEVKDWAAAAQP